MGFQNNEIECFIQYDLAQCVTIECKHGCVEESFLVSAIYAKCTRSDRLGLWKHLESISTNSKTWLIIEEILTLLEVLKRLGGNPIDFRAAVDFNDCIFSCGLLVLFGEYLYLEVVWAPNAAEVRSNAL